MGIFSNLFSTSIKEEQIIVFEDGSKKPLSEFVGQCFLSSCTAHVAHISDFVNSALLPPKENLDSIEQFSTEHSDLLMGGMDTNFILEEVFKFYYFIIYKYVLSELKTIEGFDYSLFQNNFSQYVSKSLLDLNYEKYSGRLFDEDYLGSLREDFPDDPHPPYHMDDDKSFPEFYKAISPYFEKLSSEDLILTEKIMHPYIKSSSLITTTPPGVEADEIGLTIFFGSFFRILKALPEGYEVHEQFYEQKNSHLFNDGFDLMVDATWKNMFPMQQICLMYIKAQLLR